MPLTEGRILVFSKFNSKLEKFITEEDAATAVEYGVMLMLIVGVCITAIQAVGTQASQTWSGNEASVDAALQNAKSLSNR